jgi:hypothetical protein
MRRLNPQAEAVVRFFGFQTAIEPKPTVTLPATGRSLVLVPPSGLALNQQEVT